MRIRGKITHWNRNKGYNFMTPESGPDVPAGM
jgi:cold shock CspA family protein